MSSDSPSGPDTVKNSYLYIKEKRGNLYLSLVLCIEAFALPIVIRTSNAEAHADMFIIILECLM